MCVFFLGAQLDDIPQPPWYLSVIISLISSQWPGGEMLCLLPGLAFGNLPHLLLQVPSLSFLDTEENDQTLVQGQQTMPQEPI